jgi:hypothetical protein
MLRIVFLILASGQALLVDSEATANVTPLPQNVTVSTLCALAGNTESAAADTQMDLEYSAPEGVTVPALRLAWLAERDPAKREAMAHELVRAAIWQQDDQGNSRYADVIDEVARDGAPKRLLAPATPVITVELKTIFSISDPQTYDDARGPVFRRMTKERFEVWKKKTGWLFDAGGKLLTRVVVPRRDGDGREWYGAFLADGSWITTDLWENDTQLNAFTPKAKWEWELPGAEIVDSLDRAKLTPEPDSIDTPIGWARADKTGQKWLVSVGTDETRGYALVDPAGKMEPLSDKTNLWALAYPQAMGSRGTYPKSYIVSEDGLRTLVRTGTYHNIGVDWPIYSLPGRRNVVIGEGGLGFGFWPASHDTYIQAGYNPTQVWLFDDHGAYQGQVVGSHLAAATNGRDLLVCGSDGRVLRVSHGEKGLTIPEVRSFVWPDRTPAAPIVIYDDLHLGFFLKKGLLSSNDDKEIIESRGDNEIVLAKWSE